MEKYRIVKTMGDGTFGVVFKAISPKQEIVAIKKMKTKYKSWQQCAQLRQIKSLRKLQHPNIIKLREVILANGQLYLVFDFVETNLYQVYMRASQSNRTLTETQIKSIFFQIVSALAYLHRNGFFHRDLKPQNILCHNNEVKICDFGLARQIRSRPPFTQYVSTRWYRAPELLLHSTSYNSPADIFALACIIIELYTASPLFPGTNQIETMNKIVDLLGTPKKSDWPQGYKLALSLSNNIHNQDYNFPDRKKRQLCDLLPNASIEAVELLESMLQYSSRKRPSAAQILKHPYFDNLSIQNVQSPALKETKFVLVEKNIVEMPNNVKVENQKDMEMRRSQIKFGNSLTSSFCLTKEKFREQETHQKKQKIQFKEPEQAIKYVQENIQTKFPNSAEDEHEISKKFDELQEIIHELQMKQTQKQGKRMSNKNQQSKPQFSNSVKQQLRMPMFSLGGGLSSMTSTKALKTPLKNNKFL